MKASFLISLTVLLFSYLDTTACSCASEKSFYEGMNSAQRAALIRIDSIKMLSNYRYSTYISILDDYRNEFAENNYVANTGNSCDLALDNFRQGDTLVVTNISIDEAGGLTVSAACYTPYLLIKNKVHQGSTLSEIKKKVLATLTTIERQRLVDGVNFFPNPANETVYISGLETIEKSFIFQLYDFSGALIKEEQNQAALDLQLAAPGIYYVKILNDKGEVLAKKKVIKI